MAKNFIKVDRTTSTAVYAQELLTLVTQVRATINQLAKVKGIMDTNWLTTDFADVETLFGVPTGQGGTVYGMIRDTQKAITGVGTFTDAVTLIDRVG